MNRSHWLFISVTLLLTGVLTSGAPTRTAHAAAAQPLIVIVSSSFPLTDISTATLRRVFQGLPTAFGGHRLIPLNHPIASDTRAHFDERVLGLTPNQVGAFWIDRRIRDESGPPRTAPSPGLAMRIAATLPGAITYSAPELLNAGVRALAVDGHLHDDPAYPLR